MNEFVDVVVMLHSIGYGRNAIAEWLDCTEREVRNVFNKNKLSSRSIINSEADFWRLIDKDGINGCWNWLGRVNNKGYGQYGLNGKSHFSHRLSYNLINGEVPKNMYLCHKCDNPKCCNPEHLFVGTPQDNMIDKIIKRRQPNLVLNPEKVMEIRSLKGEYKLKEISKKVGVSLSLVKDVIYGGSWTHIK